MSRKSNTYERWIHGPNHGKPFEAKFDPLVLEASRVVHNAVRAGVAEGPGNRTRRACILCGRTRGRLGWLEGEGYLCIGKCDPPLIADRAGFLAFLP